MQMIRNTCYALYEYTIILQWVLIKKLLWYGDNVMSDDRWIVNFIINNIYYVLYTNIWFNWMMIMSSNVCAFSSLAVRRCYTLKSPA